MSRRYARRLIFSYGHVPVPLVESALPLLRKAETTPVPTKETLEKLHRQPQTQHTTECRSITDETRTQ